MLIVKHFFIDVLLECVTTIFDCDYRDKKKLPSDDQLEELCMIDSCMLA